MNHADHIADANEEAWATAASLPGTVARSQAIVTKNRVHLLGGYVNDVPSSTALTAPINPDGTLGAWTTGTSLPAAVYYSQAIVTKNRVHLLGGLINNAESSSTVYTAPIEENPSSFSSPKEPSMSNKEHTTETNEATVTYESNTSESKVSFERKEELFIEVDASPADMKVLSTERYVSEEYGVMKYNSSSKGFRFTRLLLNGTPGG